MAPPVFAAYKAARIIPYIDPARGNALYEPLPVLQNGILLTVNGRIVALSKDIRLPPDCRLNDLGDATIAPPLVNCHTHLQLSWLKGETVWHSGFTTWLKSLVPHILAFLQNGPVPEFAPAIARACNELAASGCAALADTGGSLPAALAVVDKMAAAAGLAIRHLCEWFGFGDAGVAIWPQRCADEIKLDKTLASRCLPCGHALYSTAPQIMAAAHAACKKRKQRFSFHLAESREEQELLQTGAGGIADFYRDAVLPRGWRAPGLSPFRYAEKLGLIDSHSLAVHGVWLAQDEIRDLAASGAALCLCPRSNRNLATGTAPVQELLEAGVLLCLGTDGLSSCEDLDLRKEAAYLQKISDLPAEVLLRLACANGALALNLAPAELAPGRKACFSLWDRQAI